MARSKIVLAVMLLSGLVMSGVANGYYFDIWPATVDGSQNCYPSEGYAIQGEGDFRFTKSYHHIAYLGFMPDTWAAYHGYSDGPDGIPQGKTKGGVNDSNDGVLMDLWLADKKAFHAAVYVRAAGTTVTCDPYGGAGSYQNSPVTILGFRVANDGEFRDRGADGTGTLLASGHGGCCAGYLAPLLDGGESAPAAWRMGAPNTDRAGVMGYAQMGDINEADPQAEWYKASVVDTLYAGQDVKVGSAGFGAAGFGGYSTSTGLSGAGRWAFDYVVEKSDAMMVNSGTLSEADCTGFAGEEEPRDIAGDLNYGEGWYAKKVDRCIIQALVTPNATTGIIECKGLVFSSATVDLYLNPAIQGRDQGSGVNVAYLAITATLPGDGSNNDGTVDATDLLDLAGAFGTATGDVNWQPEVDWNCDGLIDVIDLLTLVGNFGNSVP